MKNPIETIRPGTWDDGVLQKTLEFPGKARLLFEESDRSIFILMVITRRAYRHQGYARRLVAALKAKGKVVVPGCFTPDGLKCISRYFDDDFTRQQREASGQPGLGSIKRTRP